MAGMPGGIVVGGEVGAGPGGGGTPGGNPGEVQFNDAGAFGGIPWWTVDSTPGSESVEFNGRVGMGVENSPGDGPPSIVARAGNLYVSTTDPARIPLYVDGAGIWGSEGDQSADLFGVGDGGDPYLRVGPTGAVTISPSEAGAVDAGFNALAAVSVVPKPADNYGDGSSLEYAGYGVRDEDDVLFVQASAWHYPDDDYGEGSLVMFTRDAADGHYTNYASLGGSFISVSDYDELTGNPTQGAASMDAGRLRIYGGTGVASLRVMNLAGTRTYLAVMNEGATRIGRPENLADHLSGAKDGYMNPGDILLIPNPDDTTPTLAIRMRTNDGTSASATIPLTPS